MPGDVTVSDLIAIRSLAMLALTLFIVYLTYALQVQRQRLQLTEELYRENPDDFERAETEAALHRLRHLKRVDLLSRD